MKKGENMFSKPLTIDIMGPSAAGKGTQIKLLIERKLAEDPTIWTGTGDLIRRFKEGASLAAKLSKEIYAKGTRQPDYLAIYLWAHHIIENMKTGKEHLVLDGLPRSFPEAKMVDTMIRLHFERPDPIVIFLNVPDKVAYDRMVEGRKRADDTPELARKRLKWFKKDVLPAVNFFRSHPEWYHFFEINGDQSIEKVHRDILKVIDSVL